MKLPKFLKYTTQSDILRIKAGAIAASAPAPLILTGPIFGFNIFIFREKPQEQHEKNIEKRAEKALREIVHEEYQKNL